MRRAPAMTCALVVAALAVTGCTSSGGGTAAPTQSKQASTSASASSTPSSNTDGDWTLESYKLKDNGLGSFGGTARITYTGDEPHATNTFTLTIFTTVTGAEKPTEVGEALGSIADIAPGQTKTVQLVSTDDFVKGPYMVKFEKDV